MAITIYTVHSIRLALLVVCQDNRFTIQTNTMNNTPQPAKETKEHSRNGKCWCGLWHRQLPSHHPKETKGEAMINLNQKVIEDMAVSYHNDMDNEIKNNLSKSIQPASTEWEKEFVNRRYHQAVICTASDTEAELENGTVTVSSENKRYRPVGLQLMEFIRSLVGWKNIWMTSARLSITDESNDRQP